MQAQVHNRTQGPANRQVPAEAAPQAAMAVAGAGGSAASSILQRLRSELRDAHRANYEEAARDLYDRWLGEDPFEGRDAISVPQARLRLIAFVWRRATTVKTPWIHVAAGILEEGEIDRFARLGEAAAEEPVATAF